ncbi:general secretion pathway protein GspE [Methylosinus sp. R-45379]|uniref:GspE/PulE family protein n=1 Tax=unclassified Methylosinus TaxID=2624500 RepID=UPI000463C9A5|nr:MULTISPECIES: GspE/PulE family protein [unclassified Methylosinus]OAI30427.1 general secretion pathway protein GspE [Methylosinus sp. R-45379]
MSHIAFFEHLSRKGVVREAEALESARGRDMAGEIDWASLTRLTPSDFADELADFYACARIKRGELPADDFAGGRLSRRFLKDERLFPFADDDGGLLLAVAAPVEEETLLAIETALERKARIAVATADEIDAALAAACGQEQAASATEIAEAGSDDLDDLRDLARGAPVVRALDDLLRLAVEQRATDLHIEPFAGTLQARLRIDGLLKATPAPPMSMAKGLLSRLKIMAGLNITERRLPQDGRARIVVAGAEIDLRVATMPTLYGEGAVIRLLRKGSGVVALDQIGLSQRDGDILKRNLQAPFGMIIVTGPTGSGKTTTLAASLAEINEPTRKILTIEDPVEYQVPGVNQTQVHPGIGLTFAIALRAFLRQDPDVIMVGEMRDAETAHIGVHAALTGHLVLTTLHTNTAAGAITRLIDMGVESFLLASSVRAIIGQRLVRILCPDCKQPHLLTAQDIAEDARYASLGFVEGETLHRPKGCEWCNYTGFRGRRGVFEVIEASPTLRAAIGPKTDASELEAVARGEGMTSMAQDGVAKCRAGLTTIDEVFRVTMSM